MANDNLNPDNRNMKMTNVYFHVILVVNGNATQLLNTIEQEKLGLNAFMVSFTSIILQTTYDLEHIITSLEQSELNTGINFISIDITDNIKNGGVKYLFQQFASNLSRDLFNTLEGITKFEGSVEPDSDVIESVQAHKIDRILEKINESGMKSLTPHELESIKQV